MQRPIMTLVAGIAFSLAAGAALACTCLRVTTEDMWRRSDLVVVGRVSKTERFAITGVVDWRAEANLIVVERRDKGRDGVRRIKVIWAGGDDILECGCDPDLPSDQKRYRFYLRRSEEFPGAYHLLGFRPPN